MSRGLAFAVILCWGCFMMILGGIGFRIILQSVSRRGYAPPRRHRYVPIEFVARRDDKYFLYKEVLSKNHSFSSTNIKSFREHITNQEAKNMVEHAIRSYDDLLTTVKKRKLKKTFHNSNGQPFEDLIVDQSNTKVGSKLFYYIGKKPDVFKVTEDFHEHLPKKVDLSNLGSCAVIGNSGLLANGSCGKQIDQSDFVFRCNAAPLQPFIQNAGLKTNLTSFNPSILDTRYGGIKDAELLQQFVEAGCEMAESTGRRRAQDVIVILDMHGVIKEAEMLQQFVEAGCEMAESTGRRIAQHVIVILDMYGGIKEPEMLQQFVEDMQQYKGFLLASCFGAAKYEEICHKAASNYVSTENIFAMAHPDYFRNITDVWQNFDLTARPSTGLYLTTAAVLSCKEVHLYGFWPFPLMPGSKNGSVPYHYFDDMKFPNELKVVSHEMDREFASLVRLHTHGIIRMHIDGCS